MNAKLSPETGFSHMGFTLLYCYRNENSHDENYTFEVKRENLGLIQCAIKSQVAVIDKKCSFAVAGFIHGNLVSQQHETQFAALWAKQHDSKVAPNWNVYYVKSVRIQAAALKDKEKGRTTPFSRRERLYYCISITVITNKLPFTNYYYTSIRGLFFKEKRFILL